MNVDIVEEIGEVMTLVTIGQYADDKSCATAVAEAIERELAK